MPLILHIDTATENAMISLAQNEQVIHFLSNTNQKEHASFLQPGILKLLKESNVSMNQLDAVAVTAGPGSYTGLRVGMASAKGIGYSLKIPLITIGTLEVMALSVIKITVEPQLYFYCPMIDAGRMEVFTALFDERLNVMISPRAFILEPGSFGDFMQKRQIIFSGNGAGKFIKLSTQPDLLLNNRINLSAALALLAKEKYERKNFADLLSAEPAYLKQFYTPANK